MKKPKRSLSDGTYVIAVRSLYETTLPTLIMALAFLGVSADIVSQNPDPLLVILSSAGVAAAIARIGVLIAYRGLATSDALDKARALRIERWFALPYLFFALAFGAFSARVFQVASAESHMLVGALLFGYGAGVATGIFLRPRIAVASILLATVPTIILALSRADLTYVILGLLIAVFTAGGIRSMMSLYGKATSEITNHHTFATLARSDSVTGLGNRLSLREQFDRVMRASARTGVLAIYCLDLDKFKPVNDTYGHPVGDALLRAVSERMMRLLRPGDFAARVGGDEFVIVQTSMNDPGEAELLARRIARAIADPFSIEGQQIFIDVSVGYAISPDDGLDLDDLIARADEALIRVKGTGGGIAAYGSVAEPRWKLSA